MRRATALLPCAARALLPVLLAGCVGAPPQHPLAPADLQARYQADLQDCRASAVGTWIEVLDTALQGALIAAMLAWGAGGDADTVRGWALGGGLLVGGSEGAQTLQRQQRAVVLCMRARGHDAPAPLTTGAPIAPAAAPAPASAGATAALTGADAFSAERLAREQACHDAPRALLAAKGPGFETYTAACHSGDALAIRCEFGNCRVLR